MTREIFTLMACLLIAPLVQANDNLDAAKEALAKAQKSYSKDKNRTNENLTVAITKVLKSQRADTTGNELEHLARVQSSCPMCAA